MKKLFRYMIGTILLIVNLIIIGIIHIRLSIKSRNYSVYSKQPKYIPGITNLIKEISVNYLSATNVRYTGYIKTFFPDGTEKVIWKSESSRDNSKVRHDLSVRFSLLCKYYDLNENGECSPDRLKFIRAFNTNENINKETNNDIS